MPDPVPAGTPALMDPAPTPHAEAAPLTLGGRVTAWRARHKQLETVVFFAGGFCFDLLLLERIDSRPMLIHQGSYLFLLTFFLAADHHYSVAGHEAKGLWGKALHFRHEVIHFLFGTLLNAFLVFYFKASSGIFALLFMAALCAVLLANESPRFRKLGPLMRMALLGFAITSYFSYLLPVLAGFLSAWLFLAAVAVGCAVTLALWRLTAWWTRDPGWGFRRAVLPGLVVQASLVGLYFLHVVPPVPLSLKWIGIYHDVQKEAVEARLTHQRPPWRFWEHGDQVFHARPGDRVYCFVRVFAPRHFRDALMVRWAWKNPKAGWTGTDAIPLTIYGGGEEGWRGIAYKQNYTPGEWKVNVETDDGREVGNIHFTVVDDDSTEPRQFYEDLR